MELDLLEEKQIFGKNRLSLFDKYGTKAAITDFSILLGGYVLPDENNLESLIDRWWTMGQKSYTNDGNTRKDRTGWWWTKSSDGDNDARVVYPNGRRSCHNVNERDGGARPALPYSSIQSISSNTVRGANGIKEIKYGEYPQTIVGEDYSRELERAYNNRNLRTTGKNYTTDSVIYQDTNTSFRARAHTEYEYCDSKYIRFVCDYDGNGKVLSDGRTINIGEIFWVKVEPITWLVDEEKDIAITKKIIVSGVQFNNKRNYKGYFKDTNMCKFMNTYLIKDMFDNVSINKEKDASKEFVSIDNKIKILRRRIDDIRK